MDKAPRGRDQSRSVVVVTLELPRAVLAALLEAGAGSRWQRARQGVGLGLGDCEWLESEQVFEPCSKGSPCFRCCHFLVPGKGGGKWRGGAPLTHLPAILKPERGKLWLD